MELFYTKSGIILQKNVRGVSVKFVDTLRVLGRKNAEHQNHILPNFINRSVKTGTSAMNSKFS